ncbi:DEAD/DEAH box helicase [Metabacillus sp. B2-18]|uniref:DEAD/DEAH box helicase n=1 Tax=Metabacillus sp. B2-18 TaxID=2897333 RepID=UPI001E5301D9|nr:DEAD/DEAH box helicase [Metabacillus sp. B2-18]UGB30450.1 DEAD/DEAH box helicase [Metabacillus sp. B2-18]
MRFIHNNSFFTPVFTYNEGQPLSRYEKLPQISKNPHFSFSKKLQQHLQGKELLLTEIPFPLEEIQSHYEQGFIQINYGIRRKQQRLSCTRCGNTNSAFFSSFSCAKCGEQQCHYCRKCIMMGRISECTPLYSWSGPPFIEKADSKLKWEGQLSKGQAVASQHVENAVINNNELLVWAVCGAGKTEVLFKGIERGLSEGKKICIATPRTDVVLELAPRLRHVFPSTSIAALYGGSEEKHKSAALTISTTHQLLRFKQTFDCIIVDEVDAFPYSADSSLQFAVEKSRKVESSLIYLTATPSENWKNEVKQKKRDAVTIPARYHGHPLPVPEFAWCGNWRKQLSKGKLPKNVVEWLKERLTSGKQAFLFVPSVRLIDEVVGLCRELDQRIEGVHAEDPERREKVLRFRSGEMPIIVTSTILERGVTIPNSDVAVLGSEDGIFTESALVQISGRVGRSASYPTGNITFFHYGKTKAMIEAKSHIGQMNHKAHKSDYITKK